MKKQWNMLLTWLCILAIVATCTGCGKKKKAEQFSFENMGTMAQITAIDGNTVTLQMGMGGRFNLPDGNHFEDGEMPQMPDGEEFDSKNLPQMPDGEEFGGENAPQLPDGEDFNSENKPEMPNGQTPNDGLDQQPSDSMPTFSAEPIILDISQITLTENGKKITVADLSVGDILSLTYSGDTVTAAEKITFDATAKS